MEEIIKRLAKKYNKSEETIRAIVRHPYEYMRNKIIEEPGSRFLIHNFGTFEAKLWIVNLYIKKILKDYRAEKISREEAVKEITRSWQIRNRIMNSTTSPRSK